MVRKRIGKEPARVLPVRVTEEFYGRLDVLSHQRGEGLSQTARVVLERGLRELTRERKGTSK